MRQAESLGDERALAAGIEIPVAIGFGGEPALEIRILLRPFGMLSQIVAKQDPIAAGVSLNRVSA